MLAQKSRRILPLDPLPYTRDSIDASKAFQSAARLKAAREMGIPQDLVDFYEVYGFAQVRAWTRLIEAMRRE